MPQGTRCMEWAVVGLGALTAPMGSARASWDGGPCAGLGFWGGRGVQVPERGRGSGSSGPSTSGTAWPPLSSLWNWARSCSEKERSRFMGSPKPGSVPGESSSCKATGTASHREPRAPVLCPPGTRPTASPPHALSCLGDVHLLHLSQRGRLEQDAGPWARWRGAGLWRGEVDAGAGGEVAGAGVGDAGQGAVACRWGRSSVPLRGDLTGHWGPATAPEHRPQHKGGAAGTFLAPVLRLYGPELPLLLDLLQNLLVQCPLLLGQGPQPPL